MFGRFIFCCVSSLLLPTTPDRCWFIILAFRRWSRFQAGILQTGTRLHCRGTFFAAILRNAAHPPPRLASQFVVAALNSSTNWTDGQLARICTHALWFDHAMVAGSPDKNKTAGYIILACKPGSVGQGWFHFIQKTSLALHAHGRIEHHAALSSSSLAQAAHHLRSTVE